MSLKISELPLAARLGLLALLAACSVLSLDMGGAARRAWQAFPPPQDRPLPEGLSAFALAAAMGDSARAASDIGYINCLQYMGGRNASDGFWAKTLPLYSEVQWLDPGFKHANVEGISALGWLYRRPLEAERLARASLASDHKEARYGAYIAALAYQKHLNSAGALGILETEVRRPDAPDMLLRVVGNLILQQRNWREALGYWTWVQTRAREQQTLDMATRTLTLIRRHLAAPRAPAAPTRTTD
ncbi:MAG TPA: hypothetical protein VK914_12755 [bacterium]|jgi:hypothetical protein|nr:hypothetical protein [bacterium]